MSELFDERRNKLLSLRKEGIDPFPRAFENRLPIAAALAQVDSEPKVRARVAGRVMRRRNFGQLLFVDLVDQSGRLQVMVQKQALRLHDCVRRFLDDGDFLGVEGSLGRSKTGEPSLFADSGEILSKALRPVPEKWHGLTDVELRYRHRYVDLFANPEVRRSFEFRSRVIADLRSILQQRGFLEVETPILHPIAGGALARPFITHHNTLDMRLFLRIAPELYLKRLIVGGFEKVFEVGRVFRNEGISPRHNPEFTMLELYWAYVDYRAIMDLTEEIIVDLARRHCPDSRTTLGERSIVLAAPFARRRYHELISEHALIDPSDSEAVRRKARALDIDERTLPDAKVLNEVFEETVEPFLIAPTFVTHYPAAICPLAKCSAEEPELAERFELFINGWEIANAFSELNDPLDQRRRFEDQVRSKDPEVPGEVDEDYLCALEHGMPPAGGLGIGIDRLLMVLGGFLSIRDTILFPLRRPLASDGGEGTIAPSVDPS